MTFEHSFFQIFLLTLAFFGLIVLLKRHFTFLEEDHKGSPYMEQVDHSEFERQREKSK
jgi:hypothetical protein